MDEYFERFGGVRDYLRARRRRGPAGPATPRRSSAAAATCPTSPATTGSAARWPSGWRSTRRSRARAADIIKVAMLGVDRGAARPRACARRMLLQVHDELVLEVAPGEREAVEALVRAQMGGAYPLAVPLDVSVGVGRTWDDAGALTGAGPTGRFCGQGCAGARDGRRGGRRSAVRRGGAARSARVRPCGSRPSRSRAEDASRPPRPTCRSTAATRSPARTRSTARRTRSCCRETWNGTLLLLLPRLPAGRAGAAGLRPGADRRAGRAGRRRWRRALLAQGYALAGSAYATNGWAVADGVTADEELYDFFAQEVGTAQPHLRVGRLARRPDHPDAGREAPGLGLRRGAAVRGARRHQRQPRPGPRRGVRREDAAQPGPEADGFASLRRRGAELRAAPSKACSRPPAARAGVRKILLTAALVDAPSQTETYDGSTIESRGGALVEAILTALGYGTTVRHDIEQRVGGNPSGNRTRTTRPGSRRRAVADRDASRPARPRQPAPCWPTASGSRRTPPARAKFAAPGHADRRHQGPDDHPAHRGRPAGAGAERDAVRRHGRGVDGEDRGPGAALHDGAGALRRSRAPYGAGHCNFTPAS